VRRAFLSSDMRAETVPDFHPGLKSAITEVIAPATPEVDRSGAYPPAALDSLAEADPKKLLGGPCGYLSKVSFTDSRISTAPDTASFSKDVSPGSVDLGGIVEVFPHTQGAQEHMTFIQSVAKRLPMVSEYDYVSGPVMLRVRKELSPAQAGEYQAVLNAH